MSPASSDFLIKLVVATLPVILFLLGLIYLDSYKLVRLRSVLYAISAGIAAAAASYWINLGFLHYLNLEVGSYSRYVAPVVEEILKSLVLIYLIRARKVGFLVDAAIYGVALGSGFSVLENIYYLSSFPGSHALTWMIRGFGTAMMHGGATVLFGIVSKLLAEIRSSENPSIFLPGLLMAIGVHSFFNHFVVSPLVSTAGILLILPPLIFLVFGKSERTLQVWLGVGFDSDVELLRLLHSGEFSDSRIGQYLEKLRKYFPGEVVVDILCYLRIHLELSIRAKGAFMMLDSGFPVRPDSEIREKFAELKYLERRIGKTGKHAIAPFISAKSHDFWQLARLAGK